MKTIRLIVLALAMVAVALLGQGQHSALADGEYGTLYVDVLPDANNTKTGYGTINVCRDSDDLSGPLDIGDTFIIDVVIAGAPDIVAAGHELNYDATILKVTASDWATWKFGPGIGMEDQLPDTDGHFNAAWTAGTVSGDGVIQRITLETVANGQSDLYFTYTEGPGGTPEIDAPGGFSHFPPEVLVHDPPGNVRVVVGGSCPLPVGGMAELSDVSDSSGRNHMPLAGLAAAAMALVALSAGAWYARRRWVR